MESELSFFTEQHPAFLILGVSRSASTGAYAASSNAASPARNPESSCLSSLLSTALLLSAAGEAAEWHIKRQKEKE
jgi:hypothetical protein